MFWKGSGGDFLPTTRWASLSNLSCFLIDWAALLSASVADRSLRTWTNICVSVTHYLTGSKSLAVHLPELLLHSSLQEASWFIFMGSGSYGSSRLSLWVWGKIQRLSCQWPNKFLTMYGELMKLSVWNLWENLGASGTLLCIFTLLNLNNVAT